MKILCNLWKNKGNLLFGGNNYITFDQTIRLRTDDSCLNTFVLATFCRPVLFTDLDTHRQKLFVINFFYNIKAKIGHYAVDPWEHGAERWE